MTINYCGELQERMWHLFAELYQILPLKYFVLVPPRTASSELHPALCSPARTLVRHHALLSRMLITVSHSLPYETSLNKLISGLRRWKKLLFPEQLDYFSFNDTMSYIIDHNSLLTLAPWKLTVNLAGHLYNCTSIQGTFLCVTLGPALFSYPYFLFVLIISTIYFILLYILLYGTSNSLWKKVSHK